VLILDEIIGIGVKACGRLGVVFHDTFTVWRPWRLGT